MKHAVLGLALAASFALPLSGQGLSQSNPDEAAVQAVAAPVAYVYVPTSHGIYAYDASSAGKLALIAGSPFKQTTGLAIGSTGKYFITLGTFWLRAYAIGPNGAIGKQVSTLDTRGYGGGDCETYPDENLVFGTDGAVLDHGGQNVYVFLNGTWDSGGGCAVYQTYGIAANGNLTFIADDDWYTPANQQPTDGLMFAGNNKSAYAFIWDWGESEASDYWLTGFQRGNRGALGRMDFNEIDPKPEPGFDYNPGCVNCSSSVSAMAADATDHLAFVLTSFTTASYGYDAGPTQLASYTVDGKGNIASTNTWKNMPTLTGTGGQMAISPAGNILALTTGTGVQFYHFNGAKPITEFTGLVGSSGYISAMGWDKSNHLYAVNGASGRLHLYQVTPTKEAEVAGSPYTIPGGANNVFVVPR